MSRHTGIVEGKLGHNFKIFGVMSLCNSCAESQAFASHGMFHALRLE